MIFNNKTQETSVSVLVAVALSSNGQTECCIADSSYVKQINFYKDWLSEKRNSTNVLWCIKHVHVNVPYPESYEDLRDKNDS